MICKNCGAEIGDAKFCTECGASVDDKENTSEPENETSDDVAQALKRAENFEKGVIPPKDQEERHEKKKRKFYCVKNPMLGSFLCMLATALIIFIVDIILWNVDMNEPGGIIVRIAFLLAGLAALGLGVYLYFIPALRLDKMFKGKGVLLEYHIREDELSQLAEKAGKNTRIANLIWAVLSFVLACICLMINTSGNLLLWVAFCLFGALFLMFITLFFIMPKVTREIMLENGGRVIIGEKSVYYGGQYYHWGKIEPKLTYGNYNSKKQELVITYSIKDKKGSIKKRKVEMFAPERELKGITKLLNVFEINIKEYRLNEQKNKIMSGDDDSKDKS